MCCDFSGGSDTGYALYQGPIEDGIVLVQSKFEGGSKEVDTFVLDSPNPTESLPVDIRVSITLDDYPEETGFYISDESYRNIFEKPIGTYQEPNELIEEIIPLDAGVYTLTIVDSYGDG